MQNGLRFRMGLKIAANYQFTTSRLSAECRSSVLCRDRCCHPRHGPVISLLPGLVLVLAAAWAAGGAGPSWTLLLQPVAILTQHWPLESSTDLPSVSAPLDQVYRPQETEHIRLNTHSHRTRTLQRRCGAALIHLTPGPGPGQQGARCRGRGGVNHPDWRDPGKS